jgi:hypothetical protein
LWLWAGVVAAGAVPNPVVAPRASERGAATGAGLEMRPVSA